MVAIGEPVSYRKRLLDDQQPPHVQTPDDASGSEPVH
jgi:hypothetical protein